MEQGFHPAAVARTTDAARASRNAAERAAASAPDRTRAAMRELLSASPGAERAESLRQAYRFGYAAFGRRDWELNTLLFHPRDYVFRPGDLGQLVPGIGEEYEGPEPYIDANEQFLEAWSDIRVAVDEVRDFSTGLVALAQMHLRAGASGLEMTQLFADVHTWRDGWIVRQEYWWDRDAALRSLGLSQQQP